ncbi:cytochrome-c peroxidase [Aestuariibius insulae]|uniref:cytochrome-c peroxidase n=1 Tax=Aestuariibius insulae TaxID=2058287 RepID=UPI003498F466
MRQIALRERLRSKKVEDPEIFAELRDPGLYAVTKDRADLGKYRTAPLRYLVYTAPYMHNGSLSTLEEVVDFYNRGGGSEEEVWGTKSDLLRPLDLSETEKTDLVAFLKSMSGSELFVEWPDAPPYETTD